ncbi:MAG: hypothetical protein KBS81_04395 [Spirochaetales bacterium]|nr:hypothetical protein [Candidatus Physcosoma equi]
MDYSYLIRKFKGQQAKVGVIGATKGYGYTVIAAIKDSPLCFLRFVCSRHPEECKAALIGLGYDESKINICLTVEDLKNAKPDQHLVIQDYKLMTETGVDTVIETTGNTSVGSDATLIALNNGISMCMVSKETDSICGAYFNHLAEEKGLVYMLGEGDQPRNLMDLFSWAKVNGMEIVCAGKSSEYDIIYDLKSGDTQYFDNPVKNIPALKETWLYEGTETLEKRKALLKDMLYPISADLCEMNLVSNGTGFTPAAPFMNYPVARINELANIFIPKEDGGILEKGQVVDVFYNFRAADEASFAGGEFVVVKCENPMIHKLLAEKGHVVSSNGKYMCLYHPYHVLGIQTPSCIALQHFLGIGGNPDCRQVSVLAGVADRDFKKGESFAVVGHHHEIVGVTPQLLERAKLPATALPFYVLNNAVATEDIKKGEVLSADKIALDDSAKIPYECYCKGLELN